MGHLQGNQGSTRQTPVHEMKYFLTLCKWFRVIMAFCILVALVSGSYDFLLFSSSFQALLLGLGLCFQYNLPPFLTASLWPLPTCFLYPLYLHPLQSHFSIFYASSFLCPFHRSCCNFFYRCLVLHSFNNTKLSWRYFINLAVSSPCKMSFISLCVVTLQCSLSFKSPCIFLAVFLFKYAKHIQFFHGHCPSFWPIGQWG